MKKLHVQVQQLFNLLLLLIVGKYIADIYLTWAEISIILFFALGSEHILLYVKHKRLNFFSFSSLSTAIGVILMMVSTNYYLYFILIFFALFQKHFLYYNKQHFFNPSNFALIMGLLFFYHDTHIVIGQLGDSLWLAVLVCIVAVWILYRVNRLIIPFGFIIAYLFFQYTIIGSTDPVFIMEDIYYRFYSVSFILFILFMLTDPRTTPSKGIYQIGFSIILAFMATYLDYHYGFRVQHMFVALFLLSPWVLLFESYINSSDKYKLLSFFFVVVFLALSAILYIENQAPYYFEMNG